MQVRTPAFPWRIIPSSLPAGTTLVVVAVTAVVATATIEREINAIWGIERARPLGRRLAVYALGLTVGPVLVGVTALVTGDTRIGMLSIIVLFAGGAILLARARRAE